MILDEPITILKAHKCNFGADCQDCASFRLQPCLQIMSVRPRARSENKCFCTRTRAVQGQKQFNFFRLAESTANRRYTVWARKLVSPVEPPPPIEQIRTRQNLPYHPLLIICMGARACHQQLVTSHVHTVVHRNADKFAIIVGSPIPWHPSSSCDTNCIYLVGMTGVRSIDSCGKALPKKPEVVSKMTSCCFSETPMRQCP